MQNSAYEALTTSYTVGSSCRSSTRAAHSPLTVPKGSPELPLGCPDAGETNSHGPPSCPQQNSGQELCPYSVIIFRYYDDINYNSCPAKPIWHPLSLMARRPARKCGSEKSATHAFAPCPISTLKHRKHALNSASVTEMVDTSVGSSRNYTVR